MFSFLKEKLKKAVSVFTKKAEESAEVVETKKEEPKIEKPKKGKQPKAEKIKEVVKEQPKVEEIKVPEPEVREEKKGFFSKIFSKEEKVEEIKQPEEKKGFFEKIKETITTTKIDSNKFDELFFDLEMALLENNVAYEVVDKIKSDLKEKIVNHPIKRGSLESTILHELKASIENILTFEVPDLIKLIKNKKEKPFVIVFVGVNGAGKTTTIAKVANYLQRNKISCLLAAADTFRASAIEQLQEWGRRLDVKVISGQYNADPASIAFDSIRFCKAHNMDVVLVDTAGRQHSNENLMREMEKIVRVAKPDLKIFIGESLTGNDVTLQSQQFNEVVGIDGIILTKGDVDEKGGAILSASYVTKKPIIYLGCGQKLSDLKEFNKSDILHQLGL
ncbi:MAG TPA: signal recognition particle-docking protein FtsY [Candidatus Nanoarchaeia archaeon]|nr:signal recognition particle-docking protein FtsY [Candidatus Nanoarchaeia archaeon]